MENTKVDPLEIRILEHGPAIVKGNFTLIGPEGKPILLTDAQKVLGVAFCRCGRSQNQPFCDGSHAKH